MSYRPRSRSPDYRGGRERSFSPSRAREYSPSRGVDYGRDDYPPPPVPRRDDRPPPRRYDDDDRVPPPRRYDDRRRYDDDDRRPPPRRYEDERGPPRRDDRGPPPRRDDRRSHRDRDDYDDRRYRDRDRDYDRYDRGDRRDDRRHDHDDRRPPASDPSKDIIFLGLDSQLTEDELLSFLRMQHKAQVDSAKIVRDKFTGESKLFGFVQFSTLPEAIRFMDNNAPTVSMPALYGHSEPKRVKIDYAGNKEERDRGGHHGHGHAPAHSGMQVHDGTRDIGAPGAGGRVLLVRGLDPGTYVGEVTRRFADEIARMLGKDVRQAETTITRVVMINDRATGNPWRFAFVELASPELAAALLPFLITPQSQPNGFLISQVPVAVSFANLDAFVPVPAGPLGSEFLVKAAPNGGIGSNTIGRDDGEWVGYWHEAAGAAQSAPRGALPIPEKGKELDLPKEMCAFLGHLSGKKWVPPQPTTTAGDAPDVAPQQQAAGTTSGPIKISFGKKVKKEKQPEEAMVTIMSKRIGDEEEIDLIGKDTVLLSRSELRHPEPQLTAQPRAPRSFPRPRRAARYPSSAPVSRSHPGNEEHLQVEHEAGRAGGARPAKEEARARPVLSEQHQRRRKRRPIQRRRRGSGQPGGDARRREVRLHRHVAVQGDAARVVPSVPAAVQDGGGPAETLQHVGSAQGKPIRPDPAG